MEFTRRRGVDTALVFPMEARDGSGRITSPTTIAAQSVMWDDGAVPPAFAPCANVPVHLGDGMFRLDVVGADELALMFGTFSVTCEEGSTVLEVNTAVMDWVNQREYNGATDVPLSLANLAYSSQQNSNNAVAGVNDMKGTGFDTDTDSLHAISIAIGSIEVDLTPVMDAIANVLRWFTNRMVVTKTSVTLYRDDGTTPLYEQDVAETATEVDRGPAT